MEFKTSLFELREDIQLVCITVSSFPEGIGEVFKRLEQEFSETAAAGYYGLSWMDDDGQVVYKASAVKPESYSEKNYENYELRKGTYLCVSIENWMQNLPQITEAFRFLMKDKRFQDNYPCVEWYQSDDVVLCMFRLKDEQK